MNSNFQSFIFQDENDQFDQPPPLVFNETYPHTLVRRSFPLMPNKTPRTSFTSATMVELQEFHELQEELKEPPRYMGTPVITGMGNVFDEQLPQIGLHEVDSPNYNQQDQESGLQNVAEEEFKLISFPMTSTDELIDENGKKKEIAFLKDALRWSKEERQHKYVCVNCHQYKTILRRRKRRKEQNQRSLQILNSATQTINSTTSGVGPKKKYKYESRHTHAQNRVRDKRGKFIAKDKMTDKQSSVQAYTPEEKQRKSDASLPQWDMNQQMEQMGQLESYCHPYSTLSQMNGLQTIGTVTNNMHLNFDIRRLGSFNACSPVQQLDSTKELPKSYPQVTEMKGKQPDMDNGVIPPQVNEINPSGNLNLYNYGYYNTLGVRNVIDVRTMNGVNQPNGNIM